MIKILVSGVIAAVLYYLNLPMDVTYLMAALVVVGALIVVVLLNSILVLPDEDDPTSMQELTNKLRVDITLGNAIRELYIVMAFQVGSLLFFRNELIILFFSIGVVLSARTIFRYLEDTYFDEISVVVEDIKNNNNDED